MRAGTFGSGQRCGQIVPGADSSELAKRIVDGLDSQELVLQLAQIQHSSSTPLSTLYLDFLAALGHVVFDRLSAQYIAFDQFYDAFKAKSIEEGYQDGIRQKWDQTIDQAIIRVVPPPSPAGPKAIAQGDPVSPSIGTKRGRDGENLDTLHYNNYNGAESKAAKNARLLKAITAVNATLSGNGRDGMDMQRVMV